MVLVVFMIKKIDVDVYYSRFSIACVAIPSSLSAINSWKIILKIKSASHSTSDDTCHTAHVEIITEDFVLQTVECVFLTTFQGVMLGNVLLLTWYVRWIVKCLNGRLFYNVEQRDNLFSNEHMFLLAGAMVTYTQREQGFCK